MIRYCRCIRPLRLRMRFNSGYANLNFGPSAVWPTTTSTRQFTYVVTEATGLGVRVAPFPGTALSPVMATFIVSVPQTRRRPISCSRPRTLVNITQSPSADAHSRRLTFGSLNIHFLANKVDDLLEVRHDHNIDVLCLVETWHDTDYVCFRRLRSDGY